MSSAVKSLLVATRNPHKTQEIQEMLGERWQVIDLSSTDSFPEIEESGETFEENATLKAVQISELTSGLVLADDSGLMVDGLGGAPGVYSSRYAGEECNDVANNAKLLRELEHRQAFKPGERVARFCCCMVIACAGEKLAAFTGYVEGRIALQASGVGGFGYDPLFIPEGFDKSFGELAAKVKNGLSHRARALEKARRHLEAANFE